MQGQMLLNGGIVASDVGLLIPGNGANGGLQLNYDRRLGDNWKLKAGDNVVMRRLVSVPGYSVH